MTVISHLLPSMRINILILLFAILLNFGLRYFYTFHYAGFNETATAIGGDAEDYLQISYALSVTGRYGRPIGVNVKEALVRNQQPVVVADNVEADAWRPPLWPFVLALIMKLSNYDLRTMFYLRFALDSLTVVMFWLLLGSTSLNWTSRSAASMIFAIHPTWLIYSVTFLSEPLTILIHIALVLALFKLLRGQNTFVWTGVVGLLSGLSILAHPYYLFFPILLTAIFYLAKLLARRNALAILALMCLVISPWIIRNMLVYRTLKPILTTSAGMNLAKGWNSGFLRLYDNTTTEAVLDENVDAGNVSVQTGSAPERSSFYLRLALHYIRSNWRLVPAIVARKLVGAITPFPETPRSGILESGRMLFQVITFLFVVIAVASGVRQHFRNVRLAVISAMLAYLVMAVLTFSTLRYRAPLIWEELLISVVAVNFLASRFRRRDAESLPGQFLPAEAGPGGKEL